MGNVIEALPNRTGRFNQSDQMATTTLGEDREGEQVKELIEVKVKVEKAEAAKVKDGLSRWLSHCSQTKSDK
ncbi:hypothetical protein ACLOJK_026085 [Asimina triloba]